MGSLKPVERWLRHRTIALDTNIFIYALAGHPDFHLTAEFFAELPTHRSVSIITSVLTLTELTIPFHRAGNMAELENALEFAGRSMRVQRYTVTESVALRAGQLRAEHRRLKTPDAIQLATAIVHGASLFLTADRDFPRGPIAGTAIEVLRRRT